jgi:hypothetical protein
MLFGDLPLIFSELGPGVDKGTARGVFLGGSRAGQYYWPDFELKTILVGLFREEKLTLRIGALGKG